MCFPLPPHLVDSLLEYLLTTTGCFRCNKTDHPAYLCYFGGEPGHLQRQLQHRLGKITANIQLKFAGKKERVNIRSLFTGNRQQHRELATTSLLKDDVINRVLVCPRTNDVMKKKDPENVNVSVPYRLCNTSPVKGNNSHDIHETASTVNTIISRFCRTHRHQRRVPTKWYFG